MAPINDTKCTFKCEVCNGTKIIDEMTGRPPARGNNLEPKRNMFGAAIESVRKDNPNWTPILEPNDRPANFKGDVNDLSNVKEEDRPKYSKGFGPILPESIGFNGGKPHRKEGDIIPKNYDYQEGN